MVISSEAAGSANYYSKSKPFVSKIIDKKMLTKPGSTKKTYHIALCVKGSNLTFHPGDSLGVLPQNDPVLVDHMIQTIRADKNALVTDTRSGEEMTLQHFLSFKANLARLTSSFLQFIHDHEDNHDKKNHMHRMLQKENKELLLQYVHAHDPLDLLKEHSNLALPLQDLCAQFSPLLPRFYSISSSVKAYPDELHLTVALFTFSHAGEERFGVASHFLIHLAEENTTSIPIYVQPAHSFALPADPNTSIIMIGPGTGVAPFRAFMQERIHTKAPGKNWLFFGERNRSYDYFYEDYWEELQKNNSLKLDLAFSRDQTEKIYVQNKMLENAKELFAWIEGGAHIYVCGDAHKMAKEVEHTFLQIFQKEGHLSEEEAKKHFKALKTQKRYLTDVY